MMYIKTIVVSVLLPCQDPFVDESQVVRVGVERLELVLDKPGEEHGLRGVALAHHVALLVVHVVLPHPVHGCDHLLTRGVVQRGADLQIHEVLRGGVLQPEHVDQPLRGDRPPNPQVARHAVVQQVDACFLDAVQSQRQARRERHGTRVLVYHYLVEVVHGVHPRVEELHHVVEGHRQDLEDDIRPLVCRDLVRALEERALLHAQRQERQHLHRFWENELVVGVEVGRVELPVLLEDVDDLLVDDVHRVLDGGRADLLSRELCQNGPSRAAVARLK
mmetsp:Transcript_11789/g.26803  ORF Transcript_11789/g.26803 Transcript_11789/m.26803 type:complete len:276 (-) Transcript_11789:366-1193(-)